LGGDRRSQISKLDHHNNTGWIAWEKQHSWWV